MVIRTKEYFRETSMFFRLIQPAKFVALVACFTLFSTLAICLSAEKIMAQQANDGVIVSDGGQALSRSLAGNWSGGWYSQTTGHKGPLRADVRLSNSGQYRATFTGKFFKVIPFRYQMQLNVVSSDGEHLHLAGQKKLGPLMGYYAYEATVTGNHFSATYRTKRDRGTFVLRRR